MYHIDMLWLFAYVRFYVKEYDIDCIWSRLNEMVEQRSKQCWIQVLAAIAIISNTHNMI